MKHRNSWPQVGPNRYTFKNVEFVYPMQRVAVAALIDALTKVDKNITRIIIFGSSVTDYCNPWSDVDALVEGWDNSVLHLTPLVYKNEDWGYFDFDIWGTLQPDEIREEAYKNGVVVYGEDLEG